jgi:hypothetical protein
MIDAVATSNGFVFCVGLMNPDGTDRFAYLHFEEGSSFWSLVSPIVSSFDFPQPPLPRRVMVLDEQDVMIYSDIYYQTTVASPPTGTSRAPFPDHLAHRTDGDHKLFATANYMRAFTININTQLAHGSVNVKNGFEFGFKDAREGDEAFPFFQSTISNM